MAKRLRYLLDEMSGFEKPKLKLEQYATSSEMAAQIVNAIDEDMDIEEKLVGDFGCGPGILMIACAAMGAAKVVGFEVDEDVIRVCKKNLEVLEARLDSLSADVRHEDVLSPTFNPPERFDIIVMNPPFGTKNNEGVDLKFVQTALRFLVPGGAVFSLHKTSTRSGIKRHVKSWSEKVECEVVAEIRWDLPQTYRHQKKDNQDIQVDLIKYRKAD